MRTLYSEYDVNYIAGCMSLRPPQKRSLKILDDLLDELDLKKKQDLEGAVEIVHDLFPTCTDFERDFLSITFALATGVGKTRLMGAFIAYLYTQKGVKNFFVVAPNLTIYDKLKKDLGDPSSEKYVFRGLGCFSQVPPNLITGENYAERGAYVGFSDVTINIFNISKFNREIGKIHSLSEYLGKSYFDYLASRDDLVVIMDESHHYRADKGMAAINDLKPVLGLELTATPQVESGTRTAKFRNVVYEYPLSSALRDGYTKIPFAMTRRDIDVFNFDKDDLDKMMLHDGVKHHEKVKAALLDYARENTDEIGGIIVKPVKPFVLVVCQNTKHAEDVLAYVTSDEFFGGKYKKKTIIVHSNQKGTEREENVQKLLEVENFDNPVEIVIHVNILKEGWDVNNLYTIIPLRTAASQTLREQTIGRGLRLPYGKRTGNQLVDMLVVTAHDKFQQIIDEANKPDSLLKRGNVIYADDPETGENVSVKPRYKAGIQQSMYDMDVALRAQGFDEKEVEAIRGVTKKAADGLLERYRMVGKDGLAGIDTATIARRAVETVDLGELVARRTDFSDIVRRFAGQEIERQRKIIESQTMPIPQIKVTQSQKTNFRFMPFELDFSDFEGFAPIVNEVEYRNLTRNSEVVVEEGAVLDFKATNPLKVLSAALSKKNAIDYEADFDLICNLLTSLMAYFAEKYTEEQVKNIVMCYKNEIADRIYAQMTRHFQRADFDLVEEVSGVSYTICEPSFRREAGQESVSLYAQIDDGDVPKQIFTGFKKALHDEYKFDSAPERRFAMLCEDDSEVLRWLRPAPKQFNIYYDGGRRYEPDFVVETADTMYLVEIKGEDKLTAEDNIKKKERAIRYCEVANVYCQAHDMKLWKYLYIPSAQVKMGYSVRHLAERFWAK